MGGPFWNSKLASLKALGPQVRVLERLWAPVRASSLHLGRLGLLLGAKLESLGSLESALGASWELFGGVCGCLWRSWEVFWNTC